MYMACFSMLLFLLEEATEEGPRPRLFPGVSLSSTLLSGLFLPKREPLPFGPSDRSPIEPKFAMAEPERDAMRVGDGHAVRHGFFSASWRLRAWKQVRKMAMEVVDANGRNRRPKHAPAAWDARQMDAARVQELRLARTKRASSAPKGAEGVQDVPQGDLQAHLHQPHAHRKEKDGFLLREIRPVHCVFINAALFMLLLYVKP